MTDPYEAPEDTEGGVLPYAPDEDPETNTGDEVDDLWLDDDEPAEQED